VEFAGGINIGAEAITATGTGVANGGTLRNASGNNTYGGAITVGTGGTRINSDSGLLTLIGGIVTAIDKHLTIGGAGNITISTAAISGTGNLIKDGAGTLTLTANNTYSGATLVNEGTMIGVVGGSCSNSAVTVASAILVVSVIDNTKQWTCASLALNTGSKLKFICSVNPGAVAPLNIKGDLTFSGTEIVIEPRLAPGQYPLLTVGGTAPTSQTLPTLSGVTGKLTWIDKTLWLTVIPNGTLIQIF
jgi:autotransporter-associated beta strand protein